MSNHPKLDAYLNALDQSLVQIPASDRAEIIMEIKSHVLSAQEKDSEQGIDSILDSLGEPEIVAHRYLLERGLKPISPVKAQSKVPLFKWIMITFLGLFTVSAIFILMVMWKFQPLVSVDDVNQRVVILGGLIDINGKSETVNVGSRLSEMQTKKFDSTGIQVISIENESGNVQISGHAQNQILVETKATSRTQDACDVLITKTANEIAVKIRKKQNAPFFSGHSCGINVNIQSPSQMDLRIKNGAGDVQVSGIQGTLDAETGSGNLFAKGIFETSQVLAGSGNVEMTYLSLPKAGNLKVNLGSGNLTLFFPKNSAVRTKVTLGSGSLHNQLDHPESGKFLIEGNIGSGDLILKNP